MNACSHLCCAWLLLHLKNHPKCWLLWGLWFAWLLLGLGYELAWTIFHKVPLFTATKATFLCLCSCLVGKHDIINGNGNTLDNWRLTCEYSSPLLLICWFLHQHQRRRWRLDRHFLLLHHHHPHLHLHLMNLSLIQLFSLPFIFLCSLNIRAMLLLYEAASSWPIIHDILDATSLPTTSARVIVLKSSMFVEDGDDACILAMW
jgi:hypothetical protein